MMNENVTSDKRKRILIAAVKVFSEKGFHNAKVDEIAVAADVGKGTVYEYFKSKEEVFIEMMRLGNEVYAKKTSAALKRSKSAQEKLFKLMEIHFDFIKDHKNLALIMMKEYGDIKNLEVMAHKHRLEKINYLEAVLNEGIENGEFKIKDSTVAAALLFGMIGAASGMYIFAPHSPTLEQTIEGIKEMLFNGIIKH